MKIMPAVVEGHTFLPVLFNEQPAVLDFGMNNGNFAMTMIRRFGASVVGAEPSSKLFNSIPSHTMLQAKNVALGGSDGTAQLELYTQRCASLHSGANDISEGSETVTVWSLRTFLDRCAVESADLLKIDIEGAECDLLEAASDTDLLRFGQITVEFHDFMMPSLSGRVEAIKTRLASSGFVRINFSLNNGDVLFVRRDLLSPAHALMLRGPYKYAMGAVRRILSLAPVGKNVRLSAR